MDSAIAIGFNTPEAMRLLEQVKLRDRNLRVIESRDSQPSEPGRAGASVAMIWAGAMDSDSLAPLIDQMVQGGLAVVAVLSRVELGRIDPSRGVVEFCFPPVTPEELALRVAIARRRVGGPGGANLLAHGELTIDLDRYEVTLGGRKIDLTYKEYELLRFLAQNPDRVFSREALLRSVWEYDYFGGTRTVDVHVRRLRSKIDDVRYHFIETIWNVGYRFRSPEDQSQNQA